MIQVQILAIRKSESQVFQSKKRNILYKIIKNVVCMVRHGLSENLDLLAQLVQQCHKKECSRCETLPQFSYKTHTTMPYTKLLDVAYARAR
uniref:Putative ovule protein n=1 Tax=Solanum chacoense TaxID=4108 RepID=A0A0V0HUM9_SOLCH